MILVDSQQLMLKGGFPLRGFRVVCQEFENMYVPSLISGHFLTPSNYDDSEQKVTVVGKVTVVSCTTSLVGVSLLRHPSKKIRSFLNRRIPD